MNTLTFDNKEVSVITNEKYQTWFKYIDIVDILKCNVKLIDKIDKDDKTVLNNDVYISLFGVHFLIFLEQQRLKEFKNVFRKLYINKTV